MSHIERLGITARFKGEFAPNNLGMVDNAISRIKGYIRKRLTEEGQDGNQWGEYFNKAIAAANGRKQKVL